MAKNHIGGVKTSKKIVLLMSEEAKTDVLH